MMPKNALGATYAGWKPSKIHVAFTTAKVRDWR